MKGFIDFIREQGIVGLAVGFIMGGSISKMVTSFVNDIVNPLLGILIGATGNFQDAYLTIGKSKVLWGNFISNLIDFIIIALVVYCSVKILGISKLDKKKDNNSK